MSHNISAPQLTKQARANQTRGRLLLISLVLLFAIPAIAAKLILSQNWYQPGVTNRGELIEPKLTYSMLGIEPQTEKRWHLGYLLPQQCDSLCREQLHLLMQSYLALGKYQPRVTPVLYVADNKLSQDLARGFTAIEVNQEFIRHFESADIVLVDPLGQIVMRFPVVSHQELIKQSKDILFDFRKLLKLSRVG